MSKLTSQTGFGGASGEESGVHLSAQVKSVNGRYLETRFRIPREYSVLEMDLKKLIKEKIHRGTVDISIFKSLEESGEKPISVDHKLAQAWLSAVGELAKKFELPSHVTAEKLARVPNVIRTPEQSDIAQTEKDFVLKVFSDALENCLKEKQREGKALHDDLSKLLDGLDDFIKDIKNKKDDLDKELRTKLQERLKTLGAAGTALHPKGEDVTIDPQRMNQEILFILDRADIAEEISRATAHVKVFRQVIKASPPTGKKLEFYVQELHREINTMGSKTQNLGVTLDIIEAKTTVERLREQVQNVE